MDAQNFLELHREQFELFQAQDPDNDEFDVVFDFDGKKLYANGYKLRPVSSTFKAMLSERWTTPNEPIKIQAYSYDDFKEFLTFIYSGGCQLTNENIYLMVDIAEFYNVEVFKKKCEDFLLKIEWNFENVYSMLEFAYKYSLENLKETLHNFVTRNLLKFVSNEEFQGLQKSIIYDIVRLNEMTVRQEELFEMVYKWAENQATKKQSDDGTLVLNDIIKHELIPIATFFRVHLMKNEFLTEFFGPKTFLFTGAELSNILWCSRYNINLIDKNEKMMKGALCCYGIDEMLHIIQSQKNVSSVSHNCYCRCNEKCVCGKNCKRHHWIIRESNVPFAPLLQSKLVLKSSVSWYLVCHRHHDYPVFKSYGMSTTEYYNKMAEQYRNANYYLAVKSRNELLESDYLLAEMFVEDGFLLDSATFV